MDDVKKNPDDLTEVLLTEEEKRIYPPAADVVGLARVKSWDEESARAASDPDGFWGQAAKELTWTTPWEQVLDDSKAPFYRWFVGGRTNLFLNALERHQSTPVADKVAIIAENEAGTQRTFTYRQLYEAANRFAAGLVAAGLKKGDRITIYLPNIPETAIAMLGAVKIGVPHSVVYAGFSYQALADRIGDAQSRIVVTADGAHRRGKEVRLKEIVDKAVVSCPTVEKVVVVKNADFEVVTGGRDVWWDEFLGSTGQPPETVALEATDPAFILYTSGTTAKPKGVVHVHGGYMVGVWRTINWVFDVRQTDVYWCTADPGWITGHSYIVYGPLMAGVTSIMYEGVPDFPKNDRIWEMIERHKVTILYTAPTLVRMMMKYGEAGPKAHNLSSLRLLGSVGEPINPEAWRWFYEFIGGNRCPIMDTWWQTETGMHMICPLPVVPLKAGSATRPFPGIVADVVDRQGKPVPVGKGGFLVITKPWPAMLTTLFNNPDRYRETYWEKIPGVYTTGDMARKDADGYFWIQGRADDVMNISGHRIGSAEIESALVAHEAVVEAAVIGLPHPVKGETAKAFVILTPGTVMSDELKKSMSLKVRELMGPLAIVSDFAAVDKLPKTRSGKIMRRVLKAQELGLPVGDVSSLEE